MNRSAQYTDMILNRSPIPIKYTMVAAVTFALSDQILIGLSPVIPILILVVFVIFPFLYFAPLYFSLSQCIKSEYLRFSVC